MKYFKIKKTVTEHTTLSLVHNEDETAYKYDEIDGYEYWGVDTEDQDMLNRQHAECEAEELTYSEILPVLESCKLMKDINRLIENDIAKKYSLAEEIGLTNSDWENQKYIDYRTYVDQCKAKYHPLKVARGLREE